MASDPMNSVIHCTLIIRSQAEYSVISETLRVHYILEVPITGQRRGFADLEALFSAVRTELMETHHQIIPSDHQEGKP